MNVLCAWCEQEGIPAVIRPVDLQSYGFNVAKQESHGICDGHKWLVTQMLESSRGKMNAVSS